MTRTKTTQRLWVAGIVCALMVHTLVCTCMPAHWLRHTDSYGMPSMRTNAEAWVRYSMAGFGNTLNHFVMKRQLPVVSTGALMDTRDDGVAGFSVLLIMVAIVPAYLQRIAKLNAAGWLRVNTALDDLSPFLAIPIPPPR